MQVIEASVVVDAGVVDEGVVVVPGADEDATVVATVPLFTVPLVFVAAAVVPFVPVGAAVELPAPVEPA